MAAENSAGLVVADEQPHIVDASEEDDFLDTDTSEVGLGLLERLSVASAVPAQEASGIDADFAADKARFYSPVPWQQHSSSELPLNQADWIEWDGGKVGGRPVSLLRLTCSQIHLHRLLFPFRCGSFHRRPQLRAT